MNVEAGVSEQREWTTRWLLCWERKRHFQKSILFNLKFMQNNLNFKRFSSFKQRTYIFSTDQAGHLEQFPQVLVSDICERPCMGATDLLGTYFLL